MTTEWAPGGSARDSTDRTNDALLAEMAALRERVAALSSDDFAGRYALEVEIDGVRQRLHEATADDLASASDEWADRSGRKGEHEQNVEALEAIARMMPSQGAAGP